MDDLVIRAATDADRALVAELLTGAWGTTIVVGHGVRFDASGLPALLASQGGRPAGLLTYAIEGPDLEVVTIDAVRRGAGAGTALLDAAAGIALDRGLERVWLVTTNDNVDALRFYQRRGMRIAGINPGGVDESRKIKPSIPLTGAYGIEMHDEIILEMRPPRRVSRR